jgi:hypothetical protein
MENEAPGTAPAPAVLEVSGAAMKEKADPLVARSSLWRERASATGSIEAGREADQFDDERAMPSCTLA